MSRFFSKVESTSDTTPRDTTPRPTTTKILLSPSLDTIIPQRTYTSEEQTKIDELRKVCALSYSAFVDDSIPGGTQF